MKSLLPDFVGKAQIRLRDRRSILGFLIGSLLLHAALIAVLLWLPVPSPMQPEIVRRVSVEIVPDTPVLAAPQTEPRPLSSVDKPNAAEAPSDALNDAVSRPEQPAMVAPHHMLSQQILDDPRSSKSRKALAKLSGDDRIVQLCSLEAMAQVNAWKKSYQPDMLIAYAMKDVRIAGQTLEAEGGAFHSKREWYNIKFKCDLTDDRKSVQALSFLVGDPIPQDKWEGHNLPADTDSLN